MTVVACSPARDSGSPHASASSPVPVPSGATPGATASVGLRSPVSNPSASPATSGSPAPAEPDFTGTGCYPDIPTPFEVTVSSDKPAYARGEHATLIVDVEATGPSRVEHANAQEFDFALDLDGQEVWRWSSVAPLIRPYHYERSYRTGETRRFTATWDQRYARSGREALPGTYVLHGYFIGNMKEPPPPGRFICFDDARLTVAGG